MNNFLDEARIARQAIRKLFNIRDRYLVHCFLELGMGVLGKTLRSRKDSFQYIIYIDDEKACLDTVHHEFAHVVELILRENSIHDANFENTKQLIKKYCEEYNAN